MSASDSGTGKLAGQDTTPPPSWDVNQYQTWTDLDTATFELTHNNNDPNQQAGLSHNVAAEAWYDTQVKVKAAMDMLDNVLVAFQQEYTNLKGEFTGDAGDAFERYASQLYNAAEGVYNTLSSNDFPTIMGNIGHDIQSFSAQWWDCVQQAHNQEADINAGAAAKIGQVMQSTSDGMTEIADIVQIQKAQQTDYDNAELALYGQLRTVLQGLRQRFELRGEDLLSLDVQLPPADTQTDSRQQGTLLTPYADPQQTNAGTPLGQLQPVTSNGSDPQQTYAGTPLGQLQPVTSTGGQDGIATSTGGTQNLSPYQQGTQAAQQAGIAALDGLTSNGPATTANPTTQTGSAGTTNPAASTTNPDYQAGVQQGQQAVDSAIAGLTPPGNLTPEQQQEWEQGVAAAKQAADQSLANLTAQDGTTGGTTGTSGNALGNFLGNSNSNGIGNAGSQLTNGLTGTQTGTTGGQTVDAGTTQGVADSKTAVDGAIQNLPDYNGSDAYAQGMRAAQQAADSALDNLSAQGANGSGAPFLSPTESISPVAVSPASGGERLPDTALTGDVGGSGGGGGVGGVGTLDGSSPGTVTSGAAANGGLDTSTSGGAGFTAATGTGAVAGTSQAVVDPAGATSAGNPEMPMSPGMGGLGGMSGMGNQQRREREPSTWLQGDRRAWRDHDDDDEHHHHPSVLGRN